MRLILDAHLDLAWNALSFGRDLRSGIGEINRFESGMRDHRSRGRATTSLPELRRAGVAVCLATIQARAKPGHFPSGGFSRLDLDYPSQEIAYAVGQGQLAYYRLLEPGEVRLLHTAEDLDAHWAQWQRGPRDKLPVGIILAMEGADPIVSPGQAEAWFRDGLRCASLAHYGPSAYAAGTGASGPLTPRGVELLEEFARLGMVLDVTHLSEESFDEALDRFAGPVAASHNNCRALVPGQRQFSDAQIRRLIARDAVVGVAADAWMLYPGWQPGETSRDAVGLDALADHVEHVCRLAGNCRHAGIGSDLDGGYGTEQTPRGLETVADLQKLADLLSARGFSDADIDAVFHGNWLRYFRERLPHAPAGRAGDP